MTEALADRFTQPARYTYGKLGVVEDQSQNCILSFPKVTVPSGYDDVRHNIPSSVSELHTFVSESTRAGDAVVSGGRYGGLRGLRGSSKLRNHLGRRSRSKSDEVKISTRGHPTSRSWKGRGLGGTVSELHTFVFRSYLGNYPSDRFLSCSPRISRRRLVLSLRLKF